MPGSHCATPCRRNVGCFYAAGSRRSYRVRLAIRIGTAMTLELKMLALSIVLGLVQIALASHAASLQRGYVWTASSRDEAVPALREWRADWRGPCRILSSRFRCLPQPS